MPHHPPPSGEGREGETQRKELAVLHSSLRGISHARALRRLMTGTEKKLWAKLRAHRMLGAHFRRQVPMGSYILDFYCHSHRLVIEVDGHHHGFEEHLKADTKRDQWLSEQVLRIIRFSNWQMMNEFESVLLTVEAVLKQEI
jgi:very-short-patch-repair endonuclease